MLDAEKTNEKGRKKEKKPLPSPITEYTLPEWLTKSELYDIRKSSCIWKSGLSPPILTNSSARR